MWSILFNITSLIFGAVLGALGWSRKDDIRSGAKKVQDRMMTRSERREQNEAKAEKPVVEKAVVENRDRDRDRNRNNHNKSKPIPKSAKKEDGDE